MKSERFSLVVRVDCGSYSAAMTQKQINGLAARIERTVKRGSKYRQAKCEVPILTE